MRGGGVGWSTRQEGCSVQREKINEEMGEGYLVRGNTGEKAANKWGTVKRRWGFLDERRQGKKRSKRRKDGWIDGGREEVGKREMLHRFTKTDHRLCCYASFFVCFHFFPHFFFFFFFFF